MIFLTPLPIPAVAGGHLPCSSQRLLRLLLFDTGATAQVSSFYKTSGNALTAALRAAKAARLVEKEPMFLRVYGFGLYLATQFLLFLSKLTPSPSCSLLALSCPCPAADRHSSMVALLSDFLPLWFTSGKLCGLGTNALATRMCIFFLYIFPSLYSPKSQ